MKAVYKKPVLRLEYFTLSQSIASCGDFSDSTLGEPGNHQDRTCGWDMGNVTIWTGQGDSCDLWWGADDEYNGVCYNNPNPGLQIFGS